MALAALLAPALVQTQEAQLLPAGAPAGGGFGRAVALSGSRALVSSYPQSAAPTTTAGAHVFVRTATGWAEEAVLTPNVPGGFFPGAGVAHLALEGDVAAIGRVTDHAGEVHVFERGAVGWTTTARLVHPGPPLLPGQDFDLFGYSVSLDGGRLLVGSIRGVTLFERGSNGGTAGTPLVPDSAGTFGPVVAVVR